MTKTIAYLRVSTNKQDLNNQKLEILEYARKQELKINEFVKISASSQKSMKDRRIEELFEKLDGAAILIVTELSRLGRSTAEVITLINKLIERKIRIIAIKQNIDIKQRHDILIANENPTLRKRNSCIIY